MNTIAQNLQSIREKIGFQDMSIKEFLEWFMDCIAKIFHGHPKMIQALNRIAEAAETSAAAQVLATEALERVITHVSNLPSMDGGFSPEKVVEHEYQKEFLNTINEKFTEVSVEALTAIGLRECASLYKEDGKTLKDNVGVFKMRQENGKTDIIVGETDDEGKLLNNATAYRIFDTKAEGNLKNNLLLTPFKYDVNSEGKVIFTQACEDCEGLFYETEETNFQLIDSLAQNPDYDKYKIPKEMRVTDSILTIINEDSNAPKHELFLDRITHGTGNKVREKMVQSWKDQLSMSENGITSTIEEENNQLTLVLHNDNTQIKISPENKGITARVTLENGQIVSKEVGRWSEGGKGSDGTSKVNQELTFSTENKDIEELMKFPAVSAYLEKFGIMDYQKKVESIGKGAKTNIDNDTRNRLQQTMDFLSNSFGNPDPNVSTVNLDSKTGVIALATEAGNFKLRGDLSTIECTTNIDSKENTFIIDSSSGITPNMLKILPQNIRDIAFTIAPTINKAREMFIGMNSVKEANNNDKQYISKENVKENLTDRMSNHNARRAIFAAIDNVKDETDKLKFIEAFDNGKFSDAQAFIKNEVNLEALSGETNISVEALSAFREACAEVLDEYVKTGNNEKPVEEQKWLGHGNNDTKPVDKQNKAETKQGNPAPKKDTEERDM